MTRKIQKEIKFEKRFTFDEPRLIRLCFFSLDKPVGSRKTCYCQCIAMSLFEAMSAVRSKYGENITMNSWGSMLLSKSDTSVHYGGGEILESKYDKEYEDVLSRIHPHI